MFHWDECHLFHLLQSQYMPHSGPAFLLIDLLIVNKEIYIYLKSKKCLLQVPFLILNWLNHLLLPLAAYLTFWKAKLFWWIPPKHIYTQIINHSYWLGFSKIFKLIQNIEKFAFDSVSTMDLEFNHIFSSVWIWSFEKKNKTLINHRIFPIFTLFIIFLYIVLLENVIYISEMSISWFYFKMLIQIFIKILAI